VLTELEELEYLKLLEAEERFTARESHLAFMEHTWKYNRPFTPGFHTRMVCARIDKAFEDFRNGKSTYLQIVIPPRHGKTDMVSRWLGPHFLGEFPDHEVIQTSYQADLAAAFSSEARDIVRSPKYKELYPHIRLSNETNQKAHWILCNEHNQPTGGKLHATGIRSGLTGSGGSLIVADDFLAGRAEAESRVSRDKVWDALTNDLLTRAAPVAIVIIMATWWHWDDPHGRIQKAMKDDPDFPRFEMLSFPAQAKDYKGQGKYPTPFLFQERYSPAYYRTQYATLGKYASSALLDNNPIPRSGGLLSTEGIKIEDDFPARKDLRWARVWDLAHTAKQRTGHDPDYTSGSLITFERREGDPILHIWIGHVRRMREEAPKRDKAIKTTTEADGKFIVPAVEVSLDSRDALNYLRRAMPEFPWKGIEVKGDKVVRATPLEPIFEAPGHVHIIRGDWNDAWIDELMRFDGTGKEHDDQIDNVTAAYVLLVGSGAVKVSEETRSLLAQRRNRPR
jgi:predicted phage terminase large subunit-like protein